MTASAPRPAAVAPQPGRRPGAAAVLEVAGLSVSFEPKSPGSEVVRDVGFTLSAGEVLALVGESGSGKSVTASAILGLLPRPAQITSGSIRLGGDELTGLSQRGLSAYRGRRLGVIFQNPLASLDPSFTVRNQLGEIIRHHRPGLGSGARNELAAEWLRRVGIGDADRVLRAYPHELSGGMRQRVMIALASLAEPAVLIADEPTTALDTVVQRQVLDLLHEVVTTRDAALLLITHDFDVVEHMADRVVVLRDGRVVEAGARSEVLQRPRHPYTKLLLSSVPRLGAAPAGAGRGAAQPGADAGPPPGTGSAAASEGNPGGTGSADAGRPGRVTSGARTPLAGPADPADLTEPNDRAEAADSERGELLTVRDLTKTFALGGLGTGMPRREFTAVKDVTFAVRPGEAYGLIGRSGSGKSTVARLIGGLLPATSGSVVFDGHQITGSGGAALTRLRPRFQYVFQDATSSLNPRLTVGEQILRPLRRFGLAGRGRAGGRELLEEKLALVGLPADLGGRYPHALSGGQRQRIGIARALALEPELLVLDEPTSALDVSTQAALVELLLDLKHRLGLTYVFIGHNLALVEWICDRIGVLEQGALVDEFATDDLYDDTRAEETRALLAANLSTRKAGTP
ncbi:ATP-binding cassette domain-containing protein [Sediminivirga luteola]|uniref:ATP-binding cassette domain-containing protein n=1 Tax=Sediminivirga luteola TaxID=1774748 RepID=UPI001F56F6E8|nr:ABC transporter ATP-binding protein [Sediminivirga luteola]MCI2266333.1 ABC transporter ATP-binding protein [Sediminivirga luteola]